MSNDISDRSDLSFSTLLIVVFGALVIYCLLQKGERLYLRYVQRWAKDYLRRRLDWTVGDNGENPTAIRHLTSALCPCQYVEEYLRHKPVSQAENSCSWWFPCMPQSQTSRN
jgi:hypothetical protein